MPPRTSFCRPRPEQACFACCPPIRPPGYDHLEYRHILTREFTAQHPFDPDRPDRTRPITGFSCWGLGFLKPSPGRDPRPVLIGCRLHPGVNDGRDYRDLTGYGPKCRREACGPARVFARLPDPHASFVANLAQGLDSFEYSSRRANPGFRLLDWGPLVIARLAAREAAGLTREDYRCRWRILDRDLDPRRDGYPVELLLTGLDLAELARPEFMARYAPLRDDFIARYRRVMEPPLERRPFVHQLGLPPTVVDFLRFSLGWSRATPAQAQAVAAALAGAIAAMIT